MADIRPAVSAALAELESLGAQVVPGGPLGPLTTYRVGGPAAVVVTLADPDDLAALTRAVKASGLPVLVVGRGSNLLVSDRGFAGIAVLLDADRFGTVTVEGTTVTAGAAVPLPALARQTVEAGLTGFEWAVGVPGSLGGGVRMNAGGHGSDIAHCLTSCLVADVAEEDGRPRRWDRSDLDYAYRHSAVTPGRVVLEAELELTPGDPSHGRQTIRQIVRWRRDHQPGGQNAGSVFTNPPGDSAGRLIDASGLKGRRWGTAMVSPKHANFIQADPQGSADDVKALLDEVRAEVAERQGVTLHPEVRLIGFPEPSTTGREFGSGRVG